MSAKITSLSQNWARSASNLGTYISCLGDFSKLQFIKNLVKKWQLGESSMISLMVMMPKDGYEFEKQEQHITKCMYEYVFTFNL